MADHGIVCTMSRSGNVWDNPAMESFFSPLKTERTAFLKRAQVANIVIGGAMTDPKGDGSRSPQQQADPDLFLRVVNRDVKVSTYLVPKCIRPAQSIRIG